MGWAEGGSDMCERLLICSIRGALRCARAYTERKQSFGFCDRSVVGRCVDSLVTISVGRAR